jgi:hypothetical protein
MIVADLFGLIKNIFFYFNYFSYICYVKIKQQNKINKIVERNGRFIK